MPPMKQTTLRLSAIQREMLEKLAAKFQIDQANVIRIAISQLAEREGVTVSKRPRA
jgi:predicted transcriptional regulator